MSSVESLADDISRALGISLSNDIRTKADSSLEKTSSLQSLQNAFARADNDGNKGAFEVDPSNNARIEDLDYDTDPAAVGADGAILGRNLAISYVAAGQAGEGAERHRNDGIGTSIMRSMTDPHNLAELRNEEWLAGDARQLRESFQPTTPIQVAEASAQAAASFTGTLQS